MGAEGGFQSVGLFRPSREKTATSDPARAPLPFPARSKPCMPSKARPIQPRYRPEPRYAFAAKPGWPVRGSRMWSPFTASPDPLNEVCVKKEPLRCIVVTQAAGPAGSFRRRIARQNAAAARDQQKRGAIPAAQQLRHPVERKPLADGAQIELQPPALALNGKLLSAVSSTAAKRLAFARQRPWQKTRRAWPAPFSLRFPGKQMPARSSASFRPAPVQRSARCRCWRESG